ncbi:MAG: hypothetical protein PHU41_00695 [Sulfuricurvum sp.]|nr:hypothetical protein [Sulfuricurvum sp.]
MAYIQLRAGRFTVLILFIVPFLIGEMIGILSGILAANLYFMSAVLLYACKIPLIVIALAILQNGKEKLLSFAWFALCYSWIIRQLEKLHTSALYLQTAQVISHIRKRIASRSGQTRIRIAHYYQTIQKRFRKK